MARIEGHTLRDREINEKGGGVVKTMTKSQWQAVPIRERKVAKQGFSIVRYRLRLSERERERERLRETEREGEITRESVRG